MLREVYFKKKYRFDYFNKTSTNELIFIYINISFYTLFQYEFTLMMLVLEGCSSPKIGLILGSVGWS